jgi:hypothetical protein
MVRTSFPRSRGRILINGELGPRHCKSLRFRDFWPEIPESGSEFPLNEELADEAGCAGAATDIRTRM